MISNMRLFMGVNLILKGNEMSVPNMKFLEKKTQVFNEIVSVVSRAIDLNELCRVSFDTLDLTKLQEADVVAGGFKRELLELDNKIISVIALHQPEASDLRELISYLKMGYELDKIISGLLKFAKKVPQMLKSSSPKEEVADLVVKICDANAKILSLIKAAISSDSENFDFEENLKNSLLFEAESDDLTDKLFCKITNDSCNDDMVLVAKSLSLIKKLERVGDHGVSIINLVRYAKMGGVLGEKI